MILGPPQQRESLHAGHLHRRGVLSQRSTRGNDDWGHGWYSRRVSWRCSVSFPHASVTMTELYFLLWTLLVLCGWNERISETNCTDLVSLRTWLGNWQIKFPTCGFPTPLTGSMRWRTSVTISDANSQGAVTGSESACRRAMHH